MGQSHRPATPHLPTTSSRAVGKQLHVDPVVLGIRAIKPKCPKRDGWPRVPRVSRGPASPPCERQIRLPFVSGNALIYGIHMVTLPRPQPPQIPQACWRLRLEPGGTSARHTSFPRSLAQGPGAPCVSRLVGLELPLQSHPGKLCQAQAAVSTVGHRTACPASPGML